MDWLTRASAIAARFGPQQMATVAKDVRGAVYVEFLIAFPPLFMLFLGICQLALIASARLVVQHAALRGVRSAVVILEESPSDYDGARRGSLTEGRSSKQPGAEIVLTALDLGNGSLPSVSPGVIGVGNALSGVGPGQNGARMVPIRTSTYFPLIVLAPNQRGLGRVAEESLEQSLLPEARRNLQRALDYTRAASAITLHTPKSQQDTVRDVGATEAVTLRVTYLYHCGVPLVRTIICSSLKTLLGAAQAGSTELGKRMQHSEAKGELVRLAQASEHFFAITAEATLPNQGARYEPREPE